MTIIAYKNKIVAADSLRTYNCGRKLYGTKLFSATSPSGQKVVIGGTGDSSKVQQLVLWYMNGCVLQNFPTYEDAKSAFLFVFKLASTLPTNDPNHLYEKLEGVECLVERYSDSPTAPTVEIVYPKQGWAAGCGADYALGDMRAGGSALSGVDSAINYNCFCGGNILSFNLESL